jgi:hypothetical protein
MLGILEQAEEGELEGLHKAALDVSRGKFAQLPCRVVEHGQGEMETFLIILLLVELLPHLLLPPLAHSPEILVPQGLLVKPDQLDLPDLLETQVKHLLD